MNQAVLESKKNVVSEIQDKFTKSSSTVVAEYRGLSVAEVTELRRALRAENVEMKVYKNTLASKAADAAGFGDLKSSLTGPNAIAFGEDETAAARVMAKFAKKHKALILKGGIVEGKVVDTETIAQLSELPNREGMLSMLLSVLTAPVASFARAVNAVAEAKPADGAPAAEGAAPAEAAKAEEAKAAE
ncbi:50S ribosomal protein L10 [Anaerolactibacter massiliensis]|uniref:50S ribosomal protein L10 n=1 Tax=Anaerolactibacter massiliensis TaxID=2044573 RepID=UPI000CF85688|nr:50S ribosomal protein L10 [Anaerolactibacter massiliensis]